MIADSMTYVPREIASGKRCFDLFLQRRIMKYTLMTLCLVTVAATSLRTAQEKPDMKAADTSVVRSPRRDDDQGSGLRSVARLDHIAGCRGVLCGEANIRLAIGGPYEIQFDPKDERSGTKGLKILSYAPEEMISFQWNAPPEYPEVRNGGTWVVVQMRSEGIDRTHVTVTHLGWKEGAQWDRALVHFTRGWGDLMKRLDRRFTDGPIDWKKERMMYQESKQRKP